MDNVSKEMEILRKNQEKVLEIKSAVTKKKNAFKYHSQNEIWHFMLSLIEFLPSQIKPHGQNSFPICKDRELTRKLSSSKQCHSMPRSQAIKRPEHS